MEWGYSLLQFISFPTSVLPRLTFSAGVKLAITDRKLFGAPIIVAAVVSYSCVLCLTLNSSHFFYLLCGMEYYKLFIIFIIK